MVRAKNYEIVSTFVKVIERIVASFFRGHGVQTDMCYSILC